MPHFARARGMRAATTQVFGTIILSTMALLAIAPLGVAAEAGTGFTYQDRLSANGVSAITPEPGSHVLLSPTGNVGISTTNPAAKLEVKGGLIKASGGFIIETRTNDLPTP